MLDKFLDLRKAFQDENHGNNLLWYTSFVTGNFRNTKLGGDTRRFSLRPLLGFIRYCLIDLPFSPQAAPEDIKVVFATVFLWRKGKMSDAFFSDLPGQLNEDGIRSVYAGKVAHHFRRDIEERAWSVNGIKGYTPARLLSKFDGLLCLLKSILVYMSLSYPQGSRNLIAPDMRKSFTSEVPIGLLYEAMLRKIVKANPDVRIMHPLEGNTWETSCQYVGARSLGYQHSVILNDQLKVTAYQGRPLPDRIVTTGKKAMNALLQFEYPPRLLIEGYSLRQSDIYEYVPKTAAPRLVSRMLILLQGTEHRNGVLEMLRAVAAEYKDKIILTLRPHPAVPLNVMGISGGGGLEISGEPDLYKDILAHDVCGYVSSTAAMESIYLGVPVVHIKVQDALDSDPLVGCPHLKASAGTAEEIFEKAKFFADYPNYTEELNLARAYFEGYFNRPDSRMKDKFKTWLDLA